MCDLRCLPIEAAYRIPGAHVGKVYGWERPLYFSKEVEPMMTIPKPDWFDTVAAEVRAARSASVDS
ncbi:MAG: hypothetical protein NXH80_10030 [Rhodobacteraceae bacterium]|nr:hypothetical protein [Paracoccaceae bacterium]